jgi:hypothetical protein
MNLYRLSIIVGNTTVERGVWVEDVTVADGIYFFKDSNVEKQFLVATFPTNFTFITSIETKEEYDARKAK